jgi:DHA2 family multidrug resistance protein
MLVENVTATSVETSTRVQLFSGAFARQSADPVAVKQQAFSAIDGIVNSQALLLSFADVFRYVAIAFVATLPLLLLLDKGRNRAAAAAAH